MKFLLGIWIWNNWSGITTLSFFELLQIFNLKWQTYCSNINNISFLFVIYRCVKSQYQKVLNSFLDLLVPCTLLECLDRTTKHTVSSLLRIKTFSFLNISYLYVLFFITELTANHDLKLNKNPITPNWIQVGRNIIFKILKAFLLTHHKNNWKY